jgi:GT2 family glycosyltransferase
MQQSLTLPAVSDSSRRSKPPTARIAIIVLNWNGKDDTLECLDSLTKLRYSDFEVIVVDNGSHDNSVAAIRECFPRVVVLETGANLGYAEGNNVGIRAAMDRGAEFVLLLNNDTIVDPDLLSQLASAAETRSDAGVFGAKIYFYSPRDRVWYAGARWNHKLLCFDIVEDESTYGDALSTNPDTDYACGCALFVRREVLEKVGLLDARFFLTYEETDFCYRARAHGFSVAYVPRAVVWHKISASFGGNESPLVKYFMSRNYLLWTERHLSPNELRAARMHALKDVRRRLIPKIQSGVLLRPKAFIAAAKQFYWEMRELWAEPAAWAVFWGTLHYFMRRFGQAPHYVRRLGKR